MRSGLGLILCVLGLLAGCGGDGGPAAPPPSASNPPPAPPPVIGAEGGTVTESSGASVIVPAGAISSDTTIRIARDSTGAPAIPPELTAVGSMYAITPHGGAFARPVTVRIPAPTAELLPTQEYKLAKAQPDGQWEVLGATQLVGGNLEVDVQSFSFFIVLTITYPQPVFQLAPFAVTDASLDCGSALCTDRLGAVTATYTVTTNNGQLPAGDAALYIVGGADQFRLDPLSTIPASGGALTTSVTPNRSFLHTFSTSIRWPSGGFYTFGSSASRSVSWLRGPAYPGISVVDMQEKLDVVEGYEATVDAVFHGGAAREAGTGNPPGFISPTADDRAIIDWERSDNGGVSWRVVARSYQNEGNPLPFGPGPEWRPWSVGHRFVATATDQGALIRAHACYTPRAPTVAAPPCVFTSATRINVLQQNALPTIVEAPRSVLVRTGQTASLSVNASGLPAPTLQWQTRPANSNADWTNVTSGVGAMTANYTTAATTLADDGVQYRVLATNAVGSAASAPVTVSVSDLDVPPTITTQPANLSVASGSDAVFAIDAMGTAALSYQWFRGTTALPGTNGPVLRIPGATATNAGSYTVVVTNAAGSATSDPAILSVTAGTPAAVAPSIVTQPASVTATAGSTATLAVGVDGTGPFLFQWRRDGVNVAGATSAVLTFNAVALPSAGTFSVVVTNSAGSVTSNNAVLDVIPADTPTAPTITSQPATLIVPYLGSGVVAVGATGSGTLTYQWSKDGAELPGATLPVLDFRTVAEQDVGTYTVTVANSVGSVTSEAASIILLGAPVITQQPADTTVVAGRNATFLVVASGTGLRYQWSVNGTPIPGAIAATWNTGPVVSANSGAVYSVMVYNGAGLVYSQAAVLTVQTIAGPTITQQPQSVTIQPGEQAELCVAIGGTPTFDVQLQRWNGSSWTPGIDVLVNDNAPVCYFTAALTLADDGAQFRFLVDNPAGEVASNTATVTVSVPPTTTTTLRTLPMIVGTASSAIALKADGTVWAWGENASGELGQGDLNPSLVPVRVRTTTGSLERIVKISASNTHVLALDADGGVWAWGTAAALGTVGADGGTVGLLARRVDTDNGSGAFLPNIADVAAGNGISIAARRDGTVVTWGSNAKGAMGNNVIAATTVPYPRNTAALGGIVEIAAGDNRGFARNPQGTVWAWGDNTNGALGDNTVTTRPNPVQVASGTVVRVSAGATATHFILADGNARVAGKSHQVAGDATGFGLACLEQTNPTAAFIPKPVSGAGSFSTAAAVTQAGVYAFRGRLYEVGDILSDDVPNSCTRALVEFSGLENVVGASGTWGRFSHVWTSDGKVYGFGQNDVGQLGIGTTATTAGARELVGFLISTVPSGATQALSVDFDAALPPQVSPGTATPADVQAFAGLGVPGNQFGGRMLRSATGNVVTVTVTNLPPHRSVNLSFLFAAIDSLDGAGTFPAGDYFRITLDDETIFREAFANADASQIQTYLPPPGVELARRVDLGFGGPGGFNTDSAYDMGRDPRFVQIPHTTSTLTITFQVEGVGAQDINDESWAIDNLRISFNP